MKSVVQRRRLLQGTVAAFAAAALPLLHAGEPPPARYLVEIRSFEFFPKRLKARAGDVVTWVNKDIVPHTATSVDGDWDTGLINHNEQRSITLADGFQGDYLCRYHPMMRGRIQGTD